MLRMYVCSVCVYECVRYAADLYVCMYDMCVCYGMLSMIECCVNNVEICFCRVCMLCMVCRVTYACCVCM